jgi:hypothetical protein
MAGLRKETVYQVSLGGFRGDKIKKLLNNFLRCTHVGVAGGLKFRYELEK